MKVGLSNLLFPRITVEEAISRVVSLDVECIEIIFDIPHFPPEFEMKKLGSLKRLIDSHGLEVSVHGPVWDMNPASYYGEIRAFTMKQIKRSINACGALGGDLVVVHPGRCPMPEVEGLFSMSKKWFVELISKCLDYAKKRDIKLSLENYSWSLSHPYSYPTEMLVLAKRLDGLGITFDVGHAYLGKGKAGKPEQKIASEIKLVGKYLTHVHIHDNHGQRDDHLPPGKGDIDFRPIIRALKEINYNGRLILELWNPRLKRPMEVGRAGLKNLRELLRTS